MTRSARFRILRVTTLHEGFARLESIEVEEATRSGETRRYAREVSVGHPGTAVLPYDPARREAVLVRQLRVPVAVAGAADAHLLEAIAGLLDVEGEDPAETARREAREEAGLALGDLVFVGAPFATPGSATQRVHLFLAEIDLSTARVGDGGGSAEEHEDIEVVTLGLDDLWALVAAGRLDDMKTFALVQALRLRRPDLFR